MAITKLSITGNTTSVGISTTPVEIMLVKTKATGVPVTPNDNITTTNVQAALEQLDDIKAQATNGTLTNPTISGSASFGDNAKAKFGAGDDLQIYHDGSNSYIIDNGTGSLFMRGNSQIQLQDTNTADKFFVGTAGGAATLYFDNAQKLATTSTGIDVTGTATMDGLTVDGTGYAYLGNTAAYRGELNYDDSGNTSLTIANSWNNDNSEINFKVKTAGTGKKALQIKGSGDISFYEDTGTTPKFFWDASAERLGIGTSSPDSKLHVQSGGEAIRVNTTNENTHMSFGGTRAKFGYARIGVSDLACIQGSTGKGIVFCTDNDTFGSGEKARIDASGRVGIGTTSPSANLHVDASAPEFRLSQSGTAKVRLRTTGDNYINTGQNLGIGTSSPDSLLEVVGADPILTVRDTETGLASTNATLRLAESGGGDALNNYWDINYTANNVFRVLSNTSERMRIDSSGNVGIGTTSPSTFNTSNGAGNLVVGSGSGAEGITVYSGTTSNGALCFADGTSSTDTYKGYVQYNHNTNSMQFATGHTERMRIDSSGNVLVGKTSLGLANVGCELRPDGQITGTRTSSVVGVFNRLSTDGEICNFYKDNSTVGSIGTMNFGDMYLGTDDTGIVFNNGIDSISPVNTTNQTARDNAIDLGASNARFKDLYLSGTANVGILSLKDGNNNGQINATTSGAKIYYNAHDAHIWQRQGSEKARIDSSGNLLVGTTDTFVADNTSGNGLSYRASAGDLGVAASNTPALYANRMGSDGAIADFRKDGTSVGSIGTASGDLYIGTGSTKLRFDNANDAVYAGGGDGTGTDNNTDLGKSDERFKDLYLSGGVKGNNLTFSGNGSSEHARVDTSGNLMVGTTSQFTGGSGASTTVTVDGSVGRKGNRFNNFDDVWSSEDAVIIEGVSSFNPSNSPNAENWYFVKAVAINTGSQNIYCIQTATTLTGKIFTRYNNDAADSGTWTSWVEK